MNKGWLCGALLLPCSVVARSDVHRADSSRYAIAAGRYDSGPAVAAHHLALKASGLVDASTLYNDLVVGLYNGNELSRALRERSQDALNGHNRGGYAVDLSASYGWGERLFGCTAWRPRIEVAHHDVLGLRFRDAVYDLTFFGNRAFEDRTMHLGPGAFEMVDYQTIAFGAEHRRTGSFIEVAVVNGQQFNAARIDRADLFTAPYGRSLDLDLDGTYWRNDTVSTAFGRSNGLGAAVSMGLILPVQVGRTHGEFSATVTDLGFIVWNSNSLRVPRDTTIHYTGIRVPDVFDLDGLLVGRNDLQDTLGLAYSRGGFIRALPTVVEGRFAFGALRRVRMPHTFAYAFSVDQRNLPGYVPYLAARRTFGLGAGSVVHVEAVYGGFGGLRLGAGLQLWLGHHTLLALSCPNVIGSASNDARGKAAMAGLDVMW